MPHFSLLQEMNVSIPHLVFAGFIVFLAGIGQSAVGFGYALFATPLLVWLGIPLPSVITLVATCSMVQSGTGAWKLRDSVPWRISLISTTVRTLTLFIGLFLLKKLVNQSLDQIRTAIGGILCLLVIIQILWCPKPDHEMHWTWGGIAFIASGILAGICGMGGPPLVLWSMSHDWPTKKIRGFLFSVFAMSIPIQIVILFFTFGQTILESTLIGIAFIPIVYLGTVIGLPIGNKMGKDKLKRIAYGILLFIGLCAIISAFLGKH